MTRKSATVAASSGLSSPQSDHQEGEGEGEGEAEPQTASTSRSSKGVKLDSTHDTPMEDVEQQEEEEQDSDSDPVAKACCSSSGSASASHPNSALSTPSTSKSDLRCLLKAEKIQRIKKKEENKQLEAKIKAFNQDKSQSQSHLTFLIQQKESEVQSKDEIIKNNELKIAELNRLVNKMREEKLQKEVEDARKRREEEAKRFSERCKEIGTFETLREKNPENEDAVETASERLVRKAKEKKKIADWTRLHPRRFNNRPNKDLRTEPSEFTSSELEEAQCYQDFPNPERMAWTRTEAQMICAKEKNRGDHNYAWSNPNCFLRDFNGDLLGKWEVSSIKDKIQELIIKDFVTDKEKRKDALNYLKDTRSGVDFKLLSQEEEDLEVDCHLYSSLLWKSVKWRLDHLYTEAKEWRRDLGWCEDDWKLEELCKGEITKLRAKGKTLVFERENNYRDRARTVMKTLKRKAYEDSDDEEDEEEEDDDDEEKNDSIVLKVKTKIIKKEPVDELQKEFGQTVFSKFQYVKDKIERDFPTVTLTRREVCQYLYDHGKSRNKTIQYYKDKLKSQGLITAPKKRKSGYVDAGSDENQDG